MYSENASASTHSFVNNYVPGKMGLYLGLTGYRMNAADSLYAGFADFNSAFFMVSDRLRMCVLYVTAHVTKRYIVMVIQRCCSQ